MNDKSFKARADELSAVFRDNQVRISQSETFEMGHHDNEHQEAKKGFGNSKIIQSL